MHTVVEDLLAFFLDLFEWQKGNLGRLEQAGMVAACSSLVMVMVVITCLKYYLLAHLS